MARKKKEQQEPVIEEVVLNKPKHVQDTALADGCRDVKDLIAPSSILLSDEGDVMKVDEQYVQTFVMNGIRPNTYIGWLNELYDYNGDMDTAVFIEPVDERVAIDELTKKISQYETDQLLEAEKGSIRNTTRNSAILKELYAQRAKLEQSQENMFLVEILVNLFNKDKRELGKDAQKLISRMAGQKNRIMPLYLRQDEGFRSVLPLGVNYIDDFYRNFGTGAVSDCFPFYNAEFSQEYGYMFGLNSETGTPIFIDPFDRTTFNNANISIFGGSGAGKTYAVSLLLMHFLAQGVHGVVIDADGEFGKVTSAVQGDYLTIAPNEYALNPFDIDEEEDVTEDGEPTGRVYVDIKEKVSSLMNMVAIMVGGEMSGDVRAKISDTLLNLYQRFGINSNPESLYEESSGEFDAKTGQFVTGSRKKIMPQFSDFWNMLNELAQKEQDIDLMRVVEALSIFVKGGLYDMFDCQTSEGVDIENSHLVVFNVSKLEESILRPIAMYIVFSWCWDKFIKKNPKWQKVVILEEAWMLIKEALAGSQYTAEFVEKAARRIRKRNGSLIVSSQNVREFDRSSHGQSVLDNTTIKILLRQEPADIATTQKVFQLSEGEKKTLLTAKKGDCLIKTNEISTKGHVFAFPFEDQLISKKYLKNNQPVQNL